MRPDAIAQVDTRGGASLEDRRKYMPMQKVTVDLNAQLKALVVQQSGERGISQSTFIQMAVEQYLDHKEAEAASISESLPSILGNGSDGALSPSESEK